MKYHRYGNTGLMISELCLGTMTFGGQGNVWKNIGTTQQEQANLLLQKAFDAGINFIDTANVYSQGQSEIITGQALRNLKIPRDEFVIASKVFGVMGDGINQSGLSRYHILNAVKDSLSRLQLDYLDIYQIHGFDPITPIEETLEALNQLVQYGYVRYIGVSNWAAWQIVKALGISERQHLAKFQSLQAYYTIAGRDLEREIIPMIQSEKLGLLVWSPLAGGLLSGKYQHGDPSTAEGRRKHFDFPPVNHSRTSNCIETMQQIAAEKEVSCAQIALAWLLHQQAVTSVIIGAKCLEQLEDNLKACEVILTEDELVRLNQVSELPIEYPGWMLKRQGERRVKSIHQQTE
ncbi:MAG: 1-deoxyxylulose-5-phosphate synthase YajO [Candidatus Celerinatantimonas neptuna]|nr:MAG: 1-deoxyxylulose-5-phosphate synthase YajO [Candidatus Celerinatantimonas neptuna]